MAKATSESQVVLHIGDIKKDHAYMGRAEDYPQMDRNIVMCDSGTLRAQFAMWRACLYIAARG